MTAPGAPVASRVLVVGQDADVSIALHLHLERAGYAVYCLPGPQDVEPIARVVAPHVIVLILPAAPDGSWGNALTTAQTAAKVGVRVVMVAPSPAPRCSRDPSSSSSARSAAGSSAAGCPRPRAAPRRPPRRTGAGGTP